MQEPVAEEFLAARSMHYLDALDAIEGRLRPNWYLEIGSRSGTSLSRRKSNFIGIDPEFRLQSSALNKSTQMHFMQMTSDSFFGNGFLEKLGIRPQMAFIDGMHLFEFALRDFMNCERNCDKEGIIIFHDVLPYSYEMVSREYEPGKAWTGDVWKTILALSKWRPDLEIDVLTASKTGLACVRNLDPSSTKLSEHYDKIVAEFVNLDLREFGVSRYLERLRIVAPEQFLQDL